MNRSVLARVLLPRVARGVELVGRPVISNVRRQSSAFRSYGMPVGKLASNFSPSHPTTGILVRRSIFT